MKNRSRREFIKESGSAFGGTWLGLNLPVALAIAQTACARRDAQATWQNLTEAEAAGFSALVDQIIPPDESPGAAEMGVVYFLDEVFGDFRAGIGKTMKKGIAQLDTAASDVFGVTDGFAGLSFEQQTMLVKSIESSPLFRQMIRVTQIGAFALEEYGGNRNHEGWKLIGFEHQHVWQPPFGYYDDPVNGENVSDE